MRKPIFNSQFSILNLIKSMRLRTLPLSLAGVVCGSVLACGHTGFSLWTLVFLYLTTVSLQILSNLSNEMGDHLSGVDGVGREGPNYSMADGGLTVRQMWGAINGMVLACCLFGILMLLFSFQYLGRHTLYPGQESLWLPWTRRPICLHLLRSCQRPRRILRYCPHHTSQLQSYRSGSWNRSAECRSP